MKDVSKRPFVTIGFLGFVVMIPLAVTSTKKWIARLGGKRWQLLHWLTYVGCVAAVVHYFWLVKSDIEAPVIYGVIVSVLLGFRAMKSLPSSSTITSAVPRGLSSSK